jgi:sugar phosphate isomerase/epimerase
MRLDPGMPVALEQTTLLQLPAAEFVARARAAGFSSVGLRLADPDQPVSSRGDGWLSGLTLTSSAAAEAGVEIENVGTVSLRPGTRVSDYAPALDAGSELGARFVTAVGDDEDVRRIAGTFAAFAGEAAARGLTALLEFMPFRLVRDLPTARAVVTSRRESGALLIDNLHLCRSGGHHADLRQLPAPLMPYVQLSDALSPRQHQREPADLRTEARQDRLPPGEGDLEVPALLAAIPEGTILGVEAPSARLTAQLGADAFMRRLNLAIRHLLSVASIPGS